MVPLMAKPDKAENRGYAMAGQILPAQLINTSTTKKTCGRIIEAISSKSIYRVFRFLYTNIFDASHAITKKTYKSVTFVSPSYQRIKSDTKKLGQDAE